MTGRISRENALILSLLSLLVLAPAATVHGGSKKPCSATTAEALAACRKSAQSDLDTGTGICRNVSDKAAQKSCLADAKTTFQDDVDACKAQRAARADVCTALGQSAYEPGFAPADFDTNFAALTHPNPLFPLGIGSQWTYASGSEEDQVTITSKTKLIDGVTCIVSHDSVKDDGKPTESTDDWFAAAKNGDVYYCGEQAAQFETFPGDNPQEAELVGIEGSFKAGRDGALPGILMLASPTVGAIYRQEFALGTAEDLGQVLSTTYAFGQSAELDSHVPQALAELLCAAGDCLVTRDFSPLEPDAPERKYYAPGIGDFLEIDLSTGVVTQLVECNVDPRCEMLPQP